jgi:molybdate transport system substrate-binding protein
MASPPLRVLSAGAAKGVVQALAAPFETERATRIDAMFDSAGAIAQAVESGAACDVVILPAPMLDTLAAEALVSEPFEALGRVATGIAVAAGERQPDVHDAAALRDCLEAASALYCPDTIRSTAGIHFAGVLRTLGLHEQAAGRLRTYANGAQAMAALAAERVPGAIGCTQVTEILYTAGVVLAGPLPHPFELATIYAAAVSTSAAPKLAARAFVERLTGNASEALRRSGGFLERA